MADLSRRLLLTRAAAFIAAPAIVCAASLMPIKSAYADGRIIIDDPWFLLRPGVTLTTIEHPNTLWPGIRLWWAAEYEREDWINLRAEHDRRRSDQATD